MEHREFIEAAVGTDVLGLAEFLRDVIREVVKNTANAFLDPFATDIELSRKPQSIIPVGILFDWPRLLSDPTLEIKWTTANGDLKPVTSKVFLRMVGGILTPRKDHDEWVLTRPHGIKLGRLRANKRTYAISELLEQKVKLVNTENPQTIKPLTTWVREQSAFQIAFSSPEYFYTDGHLYKRGGFDQDISLVESIINEAAGLATVNSEKGDPEPSIAADVEFPPNSIFRFVEDTAFADSDFLWCDDNGDEWADYIALSPDKIRFIHCKHGRQRSGAGAFQIVVAQALKNLSRIHATPSDFKSKIITAKNSPMWKGTSINELRKGTTMAQFETATLQRIADPDVSREVYLVISMLSFAKWQADRQAQKKTSYFVQLVWLLASFASATREHGAKPFIICAP